MTLTTFEKIKKIAGMAVASGVAYRSLLTTMIDLDKAVEIYDLDLDALMNANVVDFANEIRNIQINIDRSTETFPDYYTPKFARKKMAEDYDAAVEMIKAAVPGCWFKSLERRINEFNGMTYIYAKLRRACAPGDLVHIRDAEDLGFDPGVVYELVEYKPEGQAMVRKTGSKGKKYQVPLEWLHLIRKGGRKKCKEPAKQVNSRP